MFKHRLLHGVFSADSARVLSLRCVFVSGVGSHPAMVKATGQARASDRGWFLSAQLSGGLGPAGRVDFLDKHWHC